MQNVVPLGGIGDLEVFCSALTLFAGDHPTAGMADAKSMPGAILLAARPGPTMPDLNGHELAHEVARRLIDLLELDGLRSILGDLYGTNEEDVWERRPSERQAEYLSAAVWGQPIDQRMPQLSSEMLARVKEWALAAIGPCEPAQIEVDAMIVKLQIGNPVMTIDGREVVLDVAPLIVDPPGRTMVPLRAISEAFGAAVSWDEATQTVTLTK